MILTRKLAHKLGAVQVISVENKRTGRYSVQPFDYLLVLDFESTCWDKYSNSSSEIIEFSVVLYDVKRARIHEHFQQYVMPVENPKLSEFCRSLTGISQRQVDNGVPIGTCLMLFKRWLNEQTPKYKLTFDTGIIGSTTFVTWSDWDLDICLKNECARKSISKPSFFNRWVDLRALYKEFYNRRPKGLNGALQEVGLKFEGTEHCGLHDARNTAHLAGRMISEGVLLRVTKDLNVYNL